MSSPTADQRSVSFLSEGINVAIRKSVIRDGGVTSEVCSVVDDPL